VSMQSETRHAVVSVFFSSLLYILTTPWVYDNYSSTHFGLFIDRWVRLYYYYVTSTVTNLVPEYSGYSYCSIKYCAYVLCTQLNSRY
jgi:hypothetical protein